MWTWKRTERERLEKALEEVRGNERLARVGVVCGRAKRG